MNLGLYCLCAPGEPDRAGTMFLDPSSSWQERWRHAPGIIDGRKANFGLVPRFLDVLELRNLGLAESFDSAGGCHERTTARENFLAYFWELNDRRVAIDPPWVWVVEFKVIGGAA